MARWLDLGPDEMESSRSLPGFAGSVACSLAFILRCSLRAGNLPPASSESPPERGQVFSFLYPHFFLWALRGPLSVSADFL